LLKEGEIMRYIFSLILLLQVSVSSASDYEPQKVIYHINYADMTRFNNTLSNMANHINAVGEENIDLKAMVHGEAIEIFMQAVGDHELQISLDSARLSGVQFLICGNTLTGYQITNADLYDVSDDDVVMAGLPEIVKLQQLGYIYVRP